MAWWAVRLVNGSTGGDRLGPLPIYAQELLSIFTIASQRVARMDMKRISGVPEETLVKFL